MATCQGLGTYLFGDEKLKFFFFLLVAHCEQKNLNSSFAGRFGLLGFGDRAVLGTVFGIKKLRHSPAITCVCVCVVIFLC